MASLGQPASLRFPSDEHHPTIRTPTISEGRTRAASPALCERPAKALRKDESASRKVALHLSSIAPHRGEPWVQPGDVSDGEVTLNKLFLMLETGRLTLLPHGQREMTTDDPVRLIGFATTFIDSPRTFWLCDPIVVSWWGDSRFDGPTAKWAVDGGKHRVFSFLLAFSGRIPVFNQGEYKWAVCEAHEWHFRKLVAKEGAAEFADLLGRFGDEISDSSSLPAALEPCLYRQHENHAFLSDNLRREACASTVRIVFTKRDDDPAVERLRQRQFQWTQVSKVEHGYIETVLRVVGNGMDLLNHRDVWEDAHALLTGRTRRATKRTVAEEFLVPFVQAFAVAASCGDSHAHAVEAFRDPTNPEHADELLRQGELMRRDHIELGANMLSHEAVRRELGSGRIATKLFSAALAAAIKKSMKEGWSSGSSEAAAAMVEALKFVKMTPRGMDKALEGRLNGGERLVSCWRTFRKNKVTNICTFANCLNCMLLLLHPDESDDESDDDVDG